jgi:hypothetical protein
MNMKLEMKSEISRHCDRVKDSAKRGSFILRLFYRFNFWFGLLLWLIPFLGYVYLYHVLDADNNSISQMNCGWLAKFSQYPDDLYGLSSTDCFLHIIFYTLFILLII